MRWPRGIRVSTAGLTVLLAAVIVAGSVWRTLGDVPGLSTYSLAYIAAFMTAIGVGEVARLSILGRRETAPMATAAGLALAMSSLVTPKETGVSASVVVVSAAVAMSLGALVQGLRGQPVRPAETAARVVGVAVAAVLFRRLRFDGQTLLEWQEAWGDTRWLVAVVMLMVSLLAVFTELTLEGAVRAQRDHSPLFKTIADEYRDALGLTTALVTTGTLIALAEDALDLMALPLFAFPLLFTQFAVRRYGKIRETYRQTIEALSRLTERAGYTPEHHAARVTELSVSIGRDLGLSLREIVELERAALLHDLGQVALRHPIPGGATVMAAPADQRRIAHDGAEIVRRTGVLDNVAHILEAQTSPYRQVREFGEDLPMASRIIKVANAFDDLSGGERSGEGLSRAMERIHLGLGYEYDPRVVDALTRVLERPQPRPGFLA